jgi:hypothetical protein
MEGWAKGDREWEIENGVGGGAGEWGGEGRKDGSR